MAYGDLGGADFQVFFFAPVVKCVPELALGPTMLLCISLTFTLELDYLTVDQEVLWSVR